MNKPPDNERLIAGRKARHDGWPAEVRTMERGVFKGYRQLILPDGRHIRMVWRSRKGVGFWVTAKGHPAYFGKTLTEATLALARTIDAKVRIV